MTHPSKDAPQPRGEPNHAALSAALQQLEPTSRHHANAFSLKSHVRQHYEELETAHSKGHTWSALAKLMHAELRLEIASETLRKYMAAIRKEREDEQAINVEVVDVQRQPSPQPTSVQRQNMPLPKNLQPSPDREFRRSHRRSDDG